MVKFEDRRIEYGSWALPQPNSGSNCRLRLYQCQAGYIAVVSWDEQSTGTSISNQIELLAKMVCETYHLVPNTVFWFEHYVSGIVPGPSYKQVTFSQQVGPFSDPKWEEFTLQELEELIGMKLE